MTLVFDESEYRKLSFSIEAPIQRLLQEKKQKRAVSITQHVVCKHWLRGLCKKADLCEFLHEYDLSKMPPCHFFTNFNACNNPECLFLHIDKETLIKDCPWYKRGFCRHGPNCKNRHVRLEPCFDYLGGFCPNGPSCKFGHPKFERPLEDGKWLPPPICTRCGNVGHRASACSDLAPRPGVPPFAFPPPQPNELPEYPPSDARMP